MSSTSTPSPNSIMATSVTARWTFIAPLAYRRTKAASVPTRYCPRVGPARRRTVRRRSVSSTQDVARDLPIGSVVVADYQNAGRGRLSHRWEAPPCTALLVSFVLAPNPLLSLAAGVAAAEACGPRVRLKWPNDLLLGNRKLGGVLVEVTPTKAICGIGINLTWAPEGASRLDQPRNLVLRRLRTSIEKWCSAPPEEILARWRQLSETLGRRVRVELPGRSFEGIAQDVGSQGELLVDGTPVSVGSLIHLDSLLPSGGRVGDRGV
jgi:BirA family transcriptional regulator, biotin operon repressor / biotin---[acetyl-CoA-carboxylase] ligase